jgi:hypothetical protein
MARNTASAIRASDSTPNPPNRQASRVRRRAADRRRPGQFDRRRASNPSSPRSSIQPAQQAEKAADPPRVEPQRRWKLNEERPERLAESRDLAEKPRQRFARRGERALMGDQLGNLDGEAERRRHGGGPALVDRRRVRPIEGRVDLGRVQSAGIALQLRAVGREALSMRARNVPAGAADVRSHARA